MGCGSVYAQLSNPKRIEEKGTQLFVKSEKQECKGRNKD